MRQRHSRRYGRRSAIGGTAALLVGLILAGVAADTAAPREGAPLPRISFSKQILMPTIKGKPLKRPAKTAAAPGRVSAGTASPANPTASSPGNLAPSGGVLRALGWRAPVMKAVGKIYPTGCTGTVIGANLVLTAAHCLYNQRDHTGRLVCRELPVANFRFVPGGSASNVQRANHINAPLGVWRVSRMWVPTAYKCANHGGTASYYADWGVMEIQPLGGKQIGSVTGAYEAWWGLPNVQQQRMYIVGYPASGFWATANGLFGRSQYFCDVNFDASFEDLDAAAGPAAGYVVPCPMNGGASGGPWFIHHPAAGKWVIAGVSGWCRGPNTCRPKANVLISRYLDDEFRQFWLSVRSQL